MQRRSCKATNIIHLIEMQASSESTPRGKCCEIDAKDCSRNCVTEKYLFQGIIGILITNPGELWSNMATYMKSLWLYRWNLWYPVHYMLWYHKVEIVLQCVPLYHFDPLVRYLITFKGSILLLIWKITKLRILKIVFCVTYSQRFLFGRMIL